MSAGIGLLMISDAVKPPLREAAWNPLQCKYFLFLERESFAEKCRGGSMPNSYHELPCEWAGVGTERNSGGEGDREILNFFNLNVSYYLNTKKN